MIDRIRNQKEIVLAVLFVITSTVAVLAWAANNFVTVARGEVMMERTLSADTEILKETKRRDDEITKQLKDLSDSIDNSNELLLTHIERYSLDSVKAQIKTTESNLFQLEQWVKVNSSDQQSEIRRQQLQTELKALELKKTCIINHNPLCD